MKSPSKAGVLSAGLLKRATMLSCPLRFVATVVPCASGLLGLLAFPATASAQEDRQAVLYGRHKHYESSQHFAAELRFSPFYPAVDTDPSLDGAQPLHKVFGGSSRILVELEVDWQAIRVPHFGTIGPGIGLGYTTMGANAPFTMPHGADGTTISGESTSLTIIPMYVVAVARADVLWRELHVPLVPYAKLGLNYSIWRASNSLGTSQYNGVVGDGGSFGTQLGVGVGFNVNVFDEYAARTFDESMGVNGTYVFIEYTRADLDGLGIQQHPMRVGGEMATFGVTVEF